MSAAQVAQRLNLSPQAVEALEQNAYAGLPEAAFVKGYIRSYAKLLQLNVEEIMARVVIETKPPGGIATARSPLEHRGRPRKERRMRSRNETRNPSSGLILRILLMMVALAAAWLLARNYLFDLDFSDVLKFLSALGEEIIRWR